METRQIDSWLRHQSCQFGNEVQWFEDNVRGAIAVRRFELIANIPGGRQ